MDEQILKVLFRIYNSEDGKDLLKYIITLKDRNYSDWKQEGGDVLRGKAICYDELILLFETAETKLINRETKTNNEWL